MTGVVTIVTNAIDEPVPTGQRDPPAASGRPRARDGDLPGARRAHPRGSAAAHGPARRVGDRQDDAADALAPPAARGRRRSSCRWPTRSRRTSSSPVSSPRSMPSWRRTGHGGSTSRLASTSELPTPASAGRHAIRARAARSAATAGRAARPRWAVGDRDARRRRPAPGDGRCAAAAAGERPRAVCGRPAVRLCRGRLAEPLRGGAIGPRAAGAVLRAALARTPRRSRRRSGDHEPLAETPVRFDPEVVRRSSSSPAAARTTFRSSPTSRLMRRSTASRRPSLPSPSSAPSPRSARRSLPRDGRRCPQSSARSWLWSRAPSRDRPERSRRRPAARGEARRGPPGSSSTCRHGSHRPARQRTPRPLRGQ